ncbi:MAG: hypothetical protein ACK4IY_01725 [Chitinophagales bacterium]
MSEFLLNSELMEATSEEFVQLIPSQRAFIDELIMEGKITSYAVSLDRKKLWAVIVADTELDAINVITRFPVFDFMQFELHELLFHNAANDLVSHSSLN